MERGRIETTSAMPTTVKPNSRDAKYLRLAEELRAQVRRGVLKPGDQLPSFVELRSSHQISRGTVEKVHALLERDGLIVREQGKGVFVAGQARKTSTGIIGFRGGGFAETRSSLYWANVTEGIQREAARHELQLLLLSGKLDGSILEKLDGLLISENEEMVYPLLKRLPDHLPRVSIMTPVNGISCVLSDDYQGSLDATRHLLSLGHTRIGVLVAGHNHLIENRLLGYQHAFRERGMEPALAWVRQLRLRPNMPDSQAEFTLQGRYTIENWLKTDWREIGCTAIMAQNDHAAVGAIDALSHAGLDVPGDVSVVGFDGTDMYNFFRPKLTTVEIPLREIGESAIAMLREQMQCGAGEIKNVVLPTRLRVGSSTGAVRSENR